MTKTTGSTLSSNVGGRIYFEEAPEGTEYPYVVFLNIPRELEKTFSEDYEIYQIQFSLFSISKGLTEITTMYSNLQTLFDECSLSITGGTLVWMKRLGSPQTMGEDHTTPSGTAKVHHWVVEYEIMISLD